MKEARMIDSDYQQFKIGVAIEILRHFSKVVRIEEVLAILHDQWDSDESLMDGAGAFIERVIHDPDCLRSDAYAAEILLTLEMGAVSQAEALFRSKGSVQPAAFLGSLYMCTSICANGSFVGQDLIYPTVMLGCALAGKASVELFFQFLLMSESFSEMDRQDSCPDQVLIDFLKLPCLKYILEGRIHMYASYCNATDSLEPVMLREFDSRYDYVRYLRAQGGSM